jgi:hypothetical protein
MPVNNGTDSSYIIVFDFLIAEVAHEPTNPYVKPTTAIAIHKIILFYLVRSLVTTAVCALHCIAADDAELPPYDDPGSCLFDLLDDKAAAVERERRRRLMKQFREQLHTQYNAQHRCKCGVTDDKQNYSTRKIHLATRANI